MQDPVDEGLTRLAAMPVPRALDGVEASVFDAIAENARSRHTSLLVGRWSVGTALVLGLIGGATPIGHGAPAQASIPIGIDGALAPSTLLLGQ